MGPPKIPSTPTLTSPYDKPKPSTSKYISPMKLSPTNNDSHNKLVNENKRSRKEDAQNDNNEKKKYFSQQTRQRKKRPCKHLFLQGKRKRRKIQKRIFQKKKS